MKDIKHECQLLERCDGYSKNIQGFVNTFDILESAGIGRLNIQEYP